MRCAKLRVGASLRRCSTGARVPMCMRSRGRPSVASHRRRQKGDGARAATAPPAAAEPSWLKLSHSKNRLKSAAAVLAAAAAAAAAAAFVPSFAEAAEGPAEDAAWETAAARARARERAILAALAPLASNSSSAAAAAAVAASSIRCIASARSSRSASIALLASRGLSASSVTALSRPRTALVTCSLPRASIARKSSTGVRVPTLMGGARPTPMQAGQIE